MISQHLDHSEITALFDNLLDDYVLTSVTDSRGKILDVSNAFCLLSGYSREELVGQSHNIVRHSDIPSDVFNDMWRTLKEGKTWQGEIKNRKRDGSFYWVYSTIHPRIVEDEIVGYISLRRDITAAKMLSENERILRKQSRDAAMGEMIGMIAHQWKQPLCVVGVMLTNIDLKSQMKTLDTAFLTESLHKMNQYVQYLSDTVDDFRSFFKPDKDKATISLFDVITYAQRIAEPALQESNIDFSIICEQKVFSMQETLRRDQLLHLQDSYDVSIYKNEMIQVILNLIRNAIDVLIEREIEDPAIEVNIYKYNNEVHIEIADNAGGIDSSFIPKLFQPYETSKGENGTGLGLYMCKTIIEEHLHGKIKLFNNDLGACFRISLKENT